MLRKVLRGSVAALAVASIAVLGTAAPAFAHQVVMINGYRIAIGWQHEPTYTGALNAVQIFIDDPKGTPVDDLGTPTSLQVTVSTGAQTSAPLDLEPSWDPDTGLGTHGEWDASVIPTTPGTYTFHLTGNLGGPVQMNFTSSDSTFNNVVDPTPVQFPVKLPNTADLATNLNRLNPRVDNAVSDGATALAASKQAHDKANSASTLAIVALVVGVVFGVVGIFFGVTARRPRST
jgi:hypothetical protein